MEPESSLQCSQEPAVHPCSAPHKYSQHSQRLFPKIHFNIILSSTPRPYEWSPPFFTLYYQNSMCIWHNLHAFCMSRSSPYPWFYRPNSIMSGPKAGMALVVRADASRRVLLNTRKLPVYSTRRLCQQTQTLNLLVVVQGQCSMGCAADESGMEGGFSAPWNWNLWLGE
jgi:hypothetical protein